MTICWSCFLFTKNGAITVYIYYIKTEWSLVYSYYCLLRHLVKIKISFSCAKQFSGSLYLAHFINLWKYCRESSWSFAVFNMKKGVILKVLAIIKSQWLRHVRHSHIFKMKSKFPYRWMSLMTKDFYVIIAAGWALCCTNPCILSSQTSSHYGNMTFEILNLNTLNTSLESI